MYTFERIQRPYPCDRFLCKPNGRGQERPEDVAWRNRRLRLYGLLGLIASFVPVKLAIEEESEWDVKLGRSLAFAVLIGRLGKLCRVMCSTWIIPSSKWCAQTDRAVPVCAGAPVEKKKQTDPNGLHTGARRPPLIRNWLRHSRSLRHASIVQKNIELGLNKAEIIQVK